MAFYAMTIFVSAFLLFQVQPLIAKIILPWFGGSAAVWSAALMFFQVALLAGYTYAHWLTTRLKPHAQLIVHGLLLFGSCLLLPILPSSGWRPVASADPTWRILALLVSTIGLPYFLLSSTGPLLQVWYVRRTGSAMPWRLFALSNFGSLLALLSFPFAIEPNFDSRMQAYVWSTIYALFAVLCGYAAWANRSLQPKHAISPISSTQEPGPTLGRMVLWVTLAGCASGLLMAITGHLSTNVAPIPLMWVLPLSVYLLTFIIAFSSDRLYDRGFLLPWLLSALAWMGYSISAHQQNLHIRYAIPIYLLGLFLCCMLCHGELAQRKPPARYLTRFYLLISLGGALGGIFVALIAPASFDTYLELPLLLMLTAALIIAVSWRRQGTAFSTWSMRIVFLASAIVFAGYLAKREKVNYDRHRFLARNFYGVLQVTDSAVGTQWAQRDLTNGTINHGSQNLNEADRYNPGSYYSLGSGAGRALKALQERGSIRYGDIGLGAGVLAAYARKGDYLRLYEINPLVPAVAQQQFSFVSHAREIGADVEILMGDARLTLERQEPQGYDLLAVDAFSSDAIPVHLLTNESFEVYFRHLKPQGVLAVHVSNRYLNLVSVCLRGAQHIGRSAIVVSDPGGRTSFPSQWVLVTANRDLLDSAQFTDAKVKAATAEDGFTGWTDRYSSLWSVVSFD